MAAHKSCVSNSKLTVYTEAAASSGRGLPVCSLHVLLYLHAPGTLASRCTLPLTPACDPDTDKQKAMDIYLTALHL